VSLHVVSAGPRTLVQDLGRPGLAALGVSPSGAADPVLLRRANALAGNRRGAACLEVLVGGLVLEATTPTVVAVAGGLGQEVTFVNPGERVAVTCRDLLAYVAVRGGVRATPILGSRSRDELAGLGPERLADGHVIHVGDDQGPGERPVPEPPPLTTTVRILPTPWPGDLPSITGITWTISPDTSRIAVRLDGPSLGVDLTVPPEGIVRGAVQLPPSGRPVVFAADHPVTGGYPIVGVAHPDYLRSLVQARPGTAIRFTRHD
jgi:allophanate hydrolase subunit 2